MCYQVLWRATNPTISYTPINLVSLTHFACCRVSWMYEEIQFNQLIIHLEWRTKLSLRMFDSTFTSLSGCNAHCKKAWPWGFPWPASFTQNNGYLLKKKYLHSFLQTWWPVALVTFRFNRAQISDKTWLDFNPWQMTDNDQPINHSKIVESRRAFKSPQSPSDVKCIVSTYIVHMRRPTLNHQNYTLKERSC